MNTLSTRRCPSAFFPSSSDPSERDARRGGKKGKSGGKKKKKRKIRLIKMTFLFPGG